MSALKPNTILIIEPRKELAQPYAYLPQESQLVHLRSTQKAVQYLQDKKPDLVVISASYSPKLVFHLLEAIKETSSAGQFLIPVVMMVDLEAENSYIPGTRWGEKLGLLYSLSTAKEVEVMLNKVCREEKNFGFN